MRVSTAIDAEALGDMTMMAVAASNEHVVDLVGVAHPQPRVAGIPAPAAETALVRATRRAIEVVVAVVGLLILAVMMPVIVLAIRLDTPGPVVFRQRRLGRDGRPFTIYKLRTMVRDAEALRDKVLPLNVMGGVTFKAVADPRVTRVGGFLRRLSLDEAPQFWNVLRGDMALVGPRPPLPSEFAQYDVRERARLMVRPGITGAWQVGGRNTLQHSEMVGLDLDYIANRSLAVDLAIVLRTVPAMLRGRGAY